MAEEREKSICPLCGSDMYEEKPLDEGVKDAFLESMLGDVPFTRTYDIMGGKLAVEVSSLSDEDNRLRADMYINIFKLIETTPDIKSFVPLLEAAMDLDSQVCSVSLVKSDGSIVDIKRERNSGIRKVLELRWEGADVKECRGVIDSALDIFSSCLFPGKSIPESVLRGVVGRHNLLVSRLIRECLDENFLTGTGR